MRDFATEILRGKEFTRYDTTNAARSAAISAPSFTNFMASIQLRIPSPNDAETECPVIRFPVDRDSHGIRIDSFLLRCLRNYTRFRLQRLIRNNAVTIGGIAVELPHRVRTDETVVIRLIEPPDKLFAPEAIPLNPLFEDEWLIAIDKPAGQIAHPVGKRQTGTLCNALQHRLDRQTGLRGILRPGIVHRIDRMTSGVMAVAKTFAAHRRLSIQFQNQEIQKTYIALVEGRLIEPRGSIDRPIGQLPGGISILMTTAAEARNPRPATTDYEVIEQFETTALLRLRPRTGRIHQIRVHLASIGHPVVGDEFYGPFGEIRASRFRDPETETRETRHFLHAAELSLTHPVTGDRLSFSAPLPAEFSRSAVVTSESTS